MARRRKRTHCGRGRLTKAQRQARRQRRRQRRKATMKFARKTLLPMLKKHKLISRGLRRASRLGILSPHQAKIQFLANMAAKKGYGKTRRYSGHLIV